VETAGVGDELDPISFVDLRARADPSDESRSRHGLSFSTSVEGEVDEHLRSERFRDLERERGYVEDLLAFQVEGVLIAPVDDSSRSTVRLLARNSVPFVLIDRSISGLDADTVQGDSVAGARQLVEHLIALGHRRIGLVIEPSGISTARDRLAGYREAHIAAGIPISPELIVESMAIDPQRGHDATMQLLNMEDRPTAVFAVNNIVAVGVVDAAREHGLKVPDDLALVCFDDVEHASRLYPFLTVMKQPAETFGTLATQLLLDRIAGRGDERHRMVVLPADFLVRESCGASLREQGRPLVVPGR
jgi:LacI family transcriptional regulator